MLGIYTSILGTYALNTKSFDITTKGDPFKARHCSYRQNKK
jgi:hypothetical protein